MIEPGKEACFVDETAQPRLECFSVTLRADLDSRGAFALRELRRHVFLERDQAAERFVMGEIDDAETALADERVDPEFVYSRTDWQCVIACALGHGGPRLV